VAIGAGLYEISDVSKESINLVRTYVYELLNVNLPHIYNVRGLDFIMMALGHITYRVMK